MSNEPYVSPAEVLERRLRLLGLERPSWDVALISFRGREGSQVLIDLFDARPLKDNVLVHLSAFPEVPLVYEAQAAGHSVVIITRCIWGGPQTSLLVEELAYLGVGVVIGFGAAGSIHEDLALGAQLVATAGAVTDGTSRQYYPDEVTIYASHELLERFQEVEVVTETSAVTVATVDAFYRETPSLITRYRQLGAAAVNMETTPLYAAASACGIKALWMGHVSDALRDDGWQHAGFGRNRMSMATAELCGEVINAL